MSVESKKSLSINCFRNNSSLKLKICGLFCMKSAAMVVFPEHCFRQTPSSGLFTVVDAQEFYLCINGRNLRICTVGIDGIVVTDDRQFFWNTDLMGVGIF